MARVRITIDCEEAHKRAFLARAATDGKSPQQMFQSLVEQYCPDDLKRAMKALGTGGDGDDAEGDEPTPARGRKK